MTGIGMKTKKTIEDKMDIPCKDDFRDPYWTNGDNERVPGSVDMGAYCRALEKYAVEATIEGGRLEDEIRKLKHKINSN